MEAMRRHSMLQAEGFSLRLSCHWPPRKKQGKSQKLKVKTSRLNNAAESQRLSASQGGWHRRLWFGVCEFLVATVSAFG
jgi:hypothetical protein